MYVKNLFTGKVLDTKIKNTSGQSVWSSDNKNFFYVHKNSTTLRPEKVFRHNIEFPSSNDTLIFYEKDETYSVYVTESKSSEYIFICSYSTLTSEFQFIKSNEPESRFQINSKTNKRTRIYS